MSSLLYRAQWYIVALLACLAALIWFMIWESSPVSRNDDARVRVVISSGMSTHRIAAQLKEKGLIRNELIFRMTLRVGGQATQLKPGAYDFKPKMSLFEIIRKITHGDVAAVWVTIPEGYTIKQIASVLKENQIIADESEFTQAATRAGITYIDTVPAPAGSLEGYLFPDTYLFAPDSTPDDVIKTMLAAFKSKVIEPLGTDVLASHLASAYSAYGLSQALAKPDAMSWYTVLTVASMIEREARVPKDRKLISAVIWNRLKKGMRLEIDATVLYAMQQHKSRLTYADLKIPSPYNTYHVHGLPAGPIGNPGLESIKAALAPARVDYLFYVAREDGSHIFSMTLDEHNRAKVKVRQHNKARARVRRGA